MLIGAVLCLALAALGLALMRRSETWSAGDFALYLMHAQNIAALRPYADTRFVFDSASALMSPQSYPPGAPLVFAPLIAIFGVNLLLLKVACICCLAAAFWVYFVLISEDEPTWFCCACVLVAALSPATTARYDFIRSEAPFMLFLYLAFLAHQRLRVGAPPWRWTLLLFAAASMTILTRTIGIVIVPAAFGAALWNICVCRQRRILAMIAIGMAAMTSAFILHVVHADTTAYISYFHGMSDGNAATIAAATTKSYATALVAVFGLDFGVAANSALLLLMLVITSLGIYRSWQAPQPLLGWFTLFYGMTVLIFPVHAEAARYLVPIVPAVMLYFLRGLRAAAAMSGIAIPIPALVIGVACVIGAPYYLRHGLDGELPWRIDAAESQAVLHYLQTGTPADTLVLAQNPRVVALLGLRHALGLPTTPTPAALAETIKRYHPGAILEQRGITDPSGQTLSAWLRGPGSGYRPVYTNPAFSVWSPAPA